MIEIDNIIISLLQEKDVEAIIRLNTDFFAAQEPTNRALGIPLEKYERYARHITNKALSEGIILSAKVEETNSLIGFLICEDDCRHLVQGLTGDNEVWKTIQPEIEMVELLEQPLRLKNYFSTGDCLRLMQGGVFPQWQRKGILSKLILYALDISKSKGFKIAIADCTSEISASALTKLGFEIINSLSYSTYESKHGNPFAALIGKRYLMKKDL
ncbi:MAG: dopamine N-acetyltransferase-like [Ignavibacteria bacterium]|nr:dopamine N-acetyltransferase-like [Ignavibacteria bacterium]